MIRVDIKSKRFKTKKLKIHVLIILMRKGKKGRNRWKRSFNRAMSKGRKWK